MSNVTAWVVKTPFPTVWESAVGDFVLGTLRRTRRQASDRAVLDYCDCRDCDCGYIHQISTCWKHLYRQGWRCVKVSLQTENTDEA